MEGITVTDCSDELLETINSTKEEIYRLKQQLQDILDTEEKYKLKCRLKELRRLQFQQIKQLG